MGQELPDNWIEVKLGDVLSLEYGKSLPKEKRTGQGFPVMGSNGEVGKHSDYLVAGPGIVVGRKGSHGEVAWIKENFFPIDTTYFVKPSEAIELKYAFNILSFIDLKSLNRSTTIPGLNRNDAYNISIPLPPILEQRRITERLDSIFNHHNILNHKLNKILEFLIIFKQTVLNQAVSGKLTEAWRMTNESEKWSYQLAKDCCEKVQSGGTPKGGGFDTTGIPFLKVYNIVNQQIDFDYKPQFVANRIQNTELKKSIAFPGDVLMNIVGPPLGKIAIISKQYQEWNLNQAITLFRPKAYLNNKFLYYFLCEGTSVRSLVKETRGVVGQVNISLSQCRQFTIPVPPIKEQLEIVKQVQTLFESADAIQAHYDLLKKKIDKLPRAILSKAFEGTLVEQDPTDEPASALFERIRLKSLANKK